MLIDSTFKPAWWLTNPHAQTVFPKLTRRITSPIDKTERFELPDGDFIDLAWGINGLSNDTPLVIFLHGLGGGMNSQYIAGFFHAVNRMGWRAVLMHFRGASQEPNRLMRVYHSGDTADLDRFLKELAEREPHTKKALVGVSLGGNALLKWLGEQESQSRVAAAVAVSVPFQLALAADRINRGASRIYQAYLLQRMRMMVSRKLKQYPSSVETFPSLMELEKFRCFWTFDDHVTAPLHGFPHVHAYYREASCRQYLPRIATPTLIIHALDDPFMPPEVLPDDNELTACTLLEVSRKGGHVGFISGAVPGVPIYWLDERIPDFLKGYLSST